MLCEVAEHTNFFGTWMSFTFITAVMAMVMSGILFRAYYWKPTFEQWQHKSNPKYPSPALVRREILQMTKGLFTAALAPALSIHLVSSGWSKAYCGVEPYGWGYLFATFVLVWVGSDFFEFYYHRLGHMVRGLWDKHKHHHVFYNPSPFAVIADDYTDQFVRALPLLIFPLLMPVNMDMLFFSFGAFFYAYGVYLHWGYERSWPDAHHRWLNSSFQHYIHHARSTLNKPYHTGFFVKLWDRMFGSVYEHGPSECLCAKCCVARGERTREAFEQIEKPDYSVLLEPRFWWNGKLAIEPSQNQA